MTFDSRQTLRCRLPFDQYVRTLRYRVQKTRSGNCFSKCLPTVKKAPNPTQTATTSWQQTNSASEEVTVSSVEWTISFLFFYGERFGLWGWGCVTVAEFNTRHSMEWAPSPSVPKFGVQTEWNLLLVRWLTFSVLDPRPFGATEACPSDRSRWRNREG